MWSNEVKEVARKIGQYYLQKARDRIETTYDIIPQYNSSHAKAEAEICRLGISKIEVEGNIVTITAARVGLLIGVRGRNIDALNKFLNMDIRVIEDTNSLNDYLIPNAYNEEYD
jgi:ribosomal protein S3